MTIVEDRPTTAKKPSASSPARFGRLKRKLPAATLGCVTAVSIYLLYLASTRVVAGTSDGATIVLEGQSINAGNLALHGWSISLDSFWTIDAMFYALAVRIFGLGPALLHLVPALLASLVILASVYIASRGQRGVALYASAATVLALLALPSPDLSFFLLQGPWHVGTALLCLLAFAGIVRNRLDWAWVVAVCLLAAGMLGDLLMLPFAVVPLCLAGVLSSLRARNWRAGSISVFGAGAGVVLAVIARVIAQLTGTFSLANRNVVLQPNQLVENLRNIDNRLPGLLGVGNIPVKDLSDGALGFQLLHLAGLALVVLCVLAAAAGMIRGITRAGRGEELSTAQRLDDLLVIAVFCDLLVFIAGAGSNNVSYAKYLTPGLIFAVVLTARSVGRTVSRIRTQKMLRTALLGGVVVIAAFGAEFATELALPAASQPASQLGAFLLAQHLTVGLGDYWSSSIVTVETKGRVTVRPVVSSATANSGSLLGYGRQSSTSWFRGKQFQFLVYDAARIWRGVNAKTAGYTFGGPVKVYDVGTYRVLIWSHLLSVALPASKSESPLQFFWK